MSETHPLNINGNHIAPFLASFYGCVVGDRVELSTIAKQNGLTMALESTPAGSTLKQGPLTTITLDTTGRYELKLAASAGVDLLRLDGKRLTVTVVSREILAAMRSGNRVHAQPSEGRRREVIHQVAPRLTDEKLAEWIARPGMHPTTDMGGALESCSKALSENNGTIKLHAVRENTGFWKLHASETVPLFSDNA